MPEKKIEVLNPVGEAKVKDKKMASRPPTLHGLKLGLLDNSKTNADHFLRRLSEKLQERFGLAEIVARKKTGFAIPVPEEAQSALARCNVLISAFGD